MTALLAFHTLPGAPDSAVFRAAQGMAWVKVCDAGAIATARACGAKVYYRPYLPDDGDCPDGAAWGAQIAAQIGGTWPDAIVYRNEISPDVGQVAQYQAWRATLRAHGYRGLCVFGSFAVGTPDFGAWPAIVKAFGDSSPDALDLHEYFDLTVLGSSPWWALRHVELLRRGLIPSTWPLFVGECGSDAIGIEDPQKRRGWQDRGKLTPDAMIADLRAVTAGCAPSVVACFVFGDGGNDPKWTTYATFDTPVEAAIRNAGIAQNHTIDFVASGPKGDTMASLPIPVESQLVNDSANRWNECGPTCIRMVCDYLGVDPGETIPTIDADETGDPSYVGYTSTNEMVAWFQARGIPAVQSQPQDVAAAISVNLARGWPCVWLGVWDRANLTGGHFEVPVADTGSAIAFNNPYGGYQETIAYADVDRYSLGWLVTIQEAKEDAMDPTLKAAAVARFSALGVRPNTDGALFKAYARMVAAWLANGQDGVLDPTPAIKPEAATPDGQHAYLLLDSGRVLHWRKDTGLVYQAEYKEMAGLFATLGWGKAA